MQTPPTQNERRTVTDVDMERCRLRAIETTRALTDPDRAAACYAAAMAMLHPRHDVTRCISCSAMVHDDTRPRCARCHALRAADHLAAETEKLRRRDAFMRRLELSALSHT